MEVQDSLYSSSLDGLVATTDEAKAFDGAQVGKKKEADVVRVSENTVSYGVFSPG